MRRPLDWEFLRHFRAPRVAPRVVTWAGTEKWIRAARESVTPAVVELDALLRASDRELERLGGDPIHRDWRRFRPLALDREEAWSDWLASLLETSRTGILARNMFGGHASDLALPSDVRREWCLPGGYRADLGVRLRSGTWLHVEVKVGDDAFAKTYDTGAALRAEVGTSASVRDYILLPDADLDAWDDATRWLAKKFEFTVTPITWRQVVTGLRRALRAGGELPFWEAWAYGFAGAAQQVLLGHPIVGGRVALERQPLHRLAALASLADVMRQEVSQ